VGCILQNHQERCAQGAGFLFPLSLAAERQLHDCNEEFSDAGGTQGGYVWRLPVICVWILQVVTAQGDI
jgi:hypothetical protein